MQKSGAEIDQTEAGQLRSALKAIDRQNYFDWVLEKSKTQAEGGKLTSLDLSWLGIRHLPSGIFDGLRFLREIRFDNNPSCYFEEGCFDNTTLQKVQLQYCKLDKVPTHAFVAGNSINCLDLSFNKVKIINTGQFAIFSRLRDLNLSHTGLTKINADSFGGLNRLTSLKLSDNHLETLSSHTFSHLKNLYSLELGNNDIRELEVDTFAGLDLLRKLSLRINFIHQLPIGVFDELKALEELSLMHNQLQNLGGQLANLSALTTLDLEMNFLTELTRSMFANCNKLIQLNLKSNQIKKVEKGIFDHMEDLEYLTLVNNPLDVESALNLPSFTQFDYSATIEKMTSEELHNAIIHHFDNEKFVQQARQQGKLQDKTRAFLRLQDATKEE